MVDGKGFLEERREKLRSLKRARHLHHRGFRSAKWNRVLARSTQSDRCKAQPLPADGGGRVRRRSRDGDSLLGEGDGPSALASDNARLPICRPAEQRRSRSRGAARAPPLEGTLHPIRVLVDNARESVRACCRDKAVGTGYVPKRQRPVERCTDVVPLPLEACVSLILATTRPLCREPRSDLNEVFEVTIAH